MFRMNTIRTTVIKVSVAAGLIAILVYLRAINCEFVDLDDYSYVHNAPAIKNLDRNLLAWAFTTSYLVFWMPLTGISFAIDYYFWGLNPAGYHLTNILLHAINAALVVQISYLLYILCQMTNDKSKEDNKELHLFPAILILAGLFWGIHPMRVESVVWISERKDVLNGFFTLGAMLFYLRYVEKSGAACHVGRWGYYWLSITFFACSLMAKSVSVVIPVLLMVADWYPLQRFKSGRTVTVLIEKTPYLILSVIMIAISMYMARYPGFLVSYDILSLAQRISISGNAVFEYCRLTLYPVGILPQYIIPDPIPVAYTYKTVVIIAFTCICAAAIKKVPWLLPLWLMFLLPLFPVLAFFQNGDQSLATRFTYLPSLVPCIAMTFAILHAYVKASQTGKRMLKLVLVPLILMLFLLYAGISQRLIDVWSNSEALWTRVIDFEPHVVAYVSRARIHMSNEEYDAAIKDFSAAISTAPGDWKPTIHNLYAFRGEAYRLVHRYGDAVNDFSSAILKNPQPVYFKHRALALKALGQIKESNEDFMRAGTDTGPLDWY